MDLVQQASETFREVIDFVERLYIELAQSKAHFNDYSCIFCSCAYFELTALISHIEDYHRDQILQGTFDLERNFEDFLRSRILGSVSTKQENIDEEEEVETAETSQSPYEMYQCAKCQQTFVSVTGITEHLVVCSRNDVCQQQHQQTVVVEPHQPVAPLILQQQHQQQQQQPPPPIINQNLYGCARCGYRFNLLRDLVLHLHSCSNDTFYNKHEYLLPHLYVQAPNNQHIVVNEAETNTTLNTPALWLMSNITGPCTEDSVMKGFWVMPPPNNQTVPLKPVVEKRSEPPALLLLQPTTTAAQSKNRTDSTLYALPTYVINELPENNRIVTATAPTTNWARPVITNEANRVNKKRAIDSKSIVNQQIIIGSTTTTTTNKRKRGSVATSAGTVATIIQQSLSASHSNIQSPIIIPTPTTTTTAAEPIMSNHFENYVITFDDNSTQVISPGDKLYEHVVNSYKEQTYEQHHVNHTNDASSNIIDLVESSSCSPPVINHLHHHHPQSMMHSIVEQQPEQQQQQIAKLHIVSNNNQKCRKDEQQQSIPPPAIIATNASQITGAQCQIDDLSHLDKPISSPVRVKIASPKDHYLASYYSFLEMRHQNKV